MESVCLTCQLPDCDDTSPACALFCGDKNHAQKAYHQIMKNDPVYREKRRARKWAWRHTDIGRKSHTESVKKYNQKNPEVMLLAGRKYHENHKEKRFLAAREYKKRRKGGVIMIKLMNQVTYRCSYCGRKTLSLNGAKIHEKEYCKHQDSPHKKAIRDIQNNCPHVEKEMVYSYIPGECVQQPDHEVCVACGFIC